MRIEELKEYLWSIRKRDAEIDRMNNMARSLEAEAMHITARYGSEAVQHSRNNHAMEDVLARKVDLEHKMDAAIDELVDMRRNVREMFDRLSRPEYVRIMTMHYLDYLSWSRIAEVTGYSVSSTKHWHAEALEEIVKSSDLAKNTGLTYCGQA